VRGRFASGVFCEILKQNIFLFLFTAELSTCGEAKTQPGDLRDDRDRSFFRGDYDE